MNRGRSKILIEKRNKKLVERYFELYEVKRKRYDDVLNILSNEEFFLEVITIENLIFRTKNGNERLKKLQSKQSKYGKQLELFK